MIYASLLFLAASNSGIPSLIELEPQVDFDSIWIQPLKDVFSKVVAFDLWKIYTETGIRKANQAVLDIVHQERPRYMLWPTRMYELLESTLQRVRQDGTLTIGWFFDDEMRFDDYSRWWIPYLDICLTCDKKSVSRYEQLDGRAIHCLNRANPRVFKKLNLPLIYDLTFVGRQFGDREAWLHHLAEGGINIQAFGAGWPNGYISTAEMVRIFNQSRINLNFVQSYGHSTQPQVKGRFFEVCMAGGFLLSEYIPGIEEYFKIDKEIVCFRTLAEAVNKIEYFLSHEAERQEIAQAGWSRAQRDHTTQGLFERTFQQIEKIISAADRQRTFTPPMEMPPRVRRLPSHYHCQVAKALIIEGYPKKRWLEELNLALHYDPENTQAHRLKLIGCLPAIVRSKFYRLKSTLLSKRDRK